ncbi:DUF3196 family protein [Candidatus Mycoplasma mahonii]|uniref:DUF3196 family protein n=1 Tax=Candidatus Mycoplasma mahonii TaxID=3004105 RepID=UPI0026F04792|nr:DUF3196 family protein [Candidatus Mycoplasma mahonii]WKX02499.1 DUF3196 family protein [Candidatus Mycoplasma mahonii]
MKNYYEEKITEIKLLIKTDLEKAFHKLKVELDMPYIPEKYEPKFSTLFLDVKSQLESKISQKKMSNEEIMEYLWSDNVLHEAIAINNLKEMNIRNFKDELKKWMEEKPDSKNISKTFLYELLSNQEVDIDIKLKGIIVNPKKNKSLFEDLEVKKALMSIDKLTDKDPSLAKLLTEEIERYLLITFPLKIKNGDFLAKQIFNIIQSMFGNNIVFSKEEEEILVIMNGQK